MSHASADDKLRDKETRRKRYEHFRMKSAKSSKNQHVSKFQYKHTWCVFLLIRMISYKGYVWEIEFHRKTDNKDTMCKYMI